MPDLTTVTADELTQLQALGSHDANREAMRRLTQRTRDEQALNILNAAGDARYRRAFDQVATLKTSGWLVTVWDAGDGIHCTPSGPKSGPHLCVTFEAPGDCRCTGTVDEDGSLTGEPLD